MKDARSMVATTAAVLAVPPSHVLVASTGVIGVPLPMDKIERGIERATFSADNFGSFAKAILTTDKSAKTARRIGRQVGSRFLPTVSHARDFDPDRVVLNFLTYDRRQFIGKGTWKRLLGSNNDSDVDWILFALNAGSSD